MARSPATDLRFPTEGVWKRGPYQKQGPYHTPDALNMRPDDTIAGRERGGSRPGIGKAYSQQVSGGSNAIRLMHDVRYKSGSSLRNLFLVSANGALWHDRATPGTLAALSTSLSLANVRLMAADGLGEVFIADYGNALADASDGVLAGGGTNEQQTATVTGTPTGGNFKLRFINQTSAVIAHNALAATVQSTLEAVASIGTGNVSVSGSAGGPWTITFQGEWAATDVELLELVDNALTGGTAPSVTIAQSVRGRAPGDQLTSTASGNFASAGIDANDYSVTIESANAIDEVQTLTISGTPTGGTFTVSFQDAETTDLAFDASAATIQTALQLLITVGEGNVRVTGSGPFTITFQGDLAGSGYELMIGDGALLTGGTAPAATVTRATEGHTTTDLAGTYTISAVATTTITLLDPDEKLYPATGVVFNSARAPKVYNPTTNLLAIWTATEGLGQVPTGCRAIVLFRDRMVMAGDPRDPHNWFMSRQGDYRDWDYAALDAGAAIAGNNADAGQIGEPITCIIAHANACLLMFGTNSCWIMRGDPGYGGQIVNLSYSIGCLDWHAWCHSDKGDTWWLSYDGLYYMPPGCGSEPVSISRERMPEELLNIDATTIQVEMAWDQRYRGIIITLTPTSGAAATHWWVDCKTTETSDSGAGTASFWPMTFAVDLHQPRAMFQRRSSTSDYSQVMLGGGDGYIRRFQHNLANDDGTNYTAYVLYGPFALGDGLSEEGIVSRIVGILDSSSGSATWTVHVGNSPQAAVAAAARETGTWTSGANDWSYPRARGMYGVVKVALAAGNTRLAIEQITIERDYGGPRKRSA